jgi:hypothetical protein
MALMMEAVITSQTSVNFCQTTRHKDLEDSHHHTRRHGNLKSQLGMSSRRYTWNIKIVLEAKCFKPMQKRFFVHNVRNSVLKISDVGLKNMAGG